MSLRLSLGAGPAPALLRGLVIDFRLSAIVVSHDLAVARLLSHRITGYEGRRGDREGMARRQERSTSMARGSSQSWMT
jgi:ABC-type phosphonate transport system ATPase subunit